MIRHVKFTPALLLALAGACATGPALFAGGGSSPQSSGEVVQSLKPQLTSFEADEILPYDFTGDGAVTASDLAILLAMWGSEGPGDLDFDGIVGPGDLALFMASWYIAPQLTLTGEFQIDIKCMQSDFNSDGLTEAFDVAMLLAAWGKNSRYDLTGDGIVGPADLAALLASWSPEARVPDPDGTGASLFDVDHDKQFTISDLVATMAQFGRRGGSADLYKDGVVDQLDMVVILDGWYTIDDQPYIEPDVPANPADISGDGSVGPIDLALLLAAFGDRNGPADLDNNGTVGNEDLAMLLAEWE
jgi:hypothetical protein